MRWWAAVLCLTGCGRLSFDAGIDGSPAGDVADARPLPASLVCSASSTRMPMTATGTTEVSVISTTGGGALALWATPGAPVSFAALDSSFAITASGTLTTGPVDHLLGAYRANSGTLFGTMTGVTQSLWTTDFTATMRLTSEDRIGVRVPVITDDTRVPQAWLRADNAGIHLAYVQSDNTLGATQLVPTTAPVLEIAAADNDNHGHVTWSEADAAEPTCYQADVYFTGGSPSLSSPGTVDTDCHDPRIESVPGASDAIVTIYRHSTGSTEINYYGADGDYALGLTTQGRAGRARFDGTRVWLAYIDTSTGTDLLRVATFDTVAQTVTSVDVPGWLPVADTGLELIRLGNTVYVALLEADTLSLLRTCF